MAIDSLNVFVLGGLDEVGNTSLGIEVGTEIFLFDAGIRPLNDVDGGANTLLPNFEYLVPKKHLIKGLFLTQITTKTAGALPFLLKKIPDLKIYAPPVNYNLLLQSELLTSAQKQNNLIAMNSAEIQFKNTKITCFETATSMIGGHGWIIETSFGNIVYMGDFVVQIKKKNHVLFSTDFNKILEKKNDNLLLIADVNEIENEGFTWPKCSPEKQLDVVWDSTKEHLFIGCFSDDWYKIYTSIHWFFKEYGSRDFYFYDARFAKLFEQIATKFMPQLNGANFLPYKDLKRETNKRKIIIITGDEKWYFSRLVSIIQEDALTEKDTILLMGEHIFNSETAMANVLDTLHHSKAKIKSLLDHQITPFKASYEDLKLTLGLIKPKFFLPFGSFFTKLSLAKNIANENDFELGKNTIIGKNFMKFNFDQQQNLTIREISPKNAVYIDSKTSDPLSSRAVYDRKNMANDGLVSVFFTNKTSLTPSRLPGVDSQFKIQIAGIELDNKEILNISDLIQSTINSWRHHKNLKTFNYQNELNRLKTKIEFKIQKLINKHPIVNFVTELI